MITSTLPPALKTEIFPDADSFTVTAFGIVCPAVQFRLDAFGCVPPAGQIVGKAGAEVLVTVTLRTAASAPAGTPPAPLTWMSRLCPPPHGMLYGPTWGPLGRESWIRAGGSDVSPSPAAVL